MSDFDIQSFIEDIKKIYAGLASKNYQNHKNKINHTEFQWALFQLGSKYNLQSQKEYRGRLFLNIDNPEKHIIGRIDNVYFKNGKPFIALEIDSGMKGHSIKKLYANKQFPYRIWFYYGKNPDIVKYETKLDKYDKNREIIFLTPDDKIWQLGLF